MAAGSGARNSARSIRRSACPRSRSRPARCCCSRSRSSNISTRSHPEPPLLPPIAIERAQVRALSQIIACDIHPLNNLVALNYLKGPLKHDQADGRRMVSPLGRAGLRRDRSADTPWPLRVRRACDDRGPLPRAAGVQCAPLQDRHRQVSKDRRGRCRLPEAAGLRQSAAGKPAGRRITTLKQDPVTVIPVEAGALGEPEPPTPPPQHIQRPGRRRSG